MDTVVNTTGAAVVVVVGVTPNDGKDVNVDVDGCNDGNDGNDADVDTAGVTVVIEGAVELVTDVLTLVDDNEPKG